MKFTIHKAYDRKKLFLFFRKNNPSLSFAEAINKLNNLPCTFENLTKKDALSCQLDIDRSADWSMENDTDGDDTDKYYIAALEWFSSLSSKEKDYVHHLMKWNVVK